MKPLLLIVALCGAILPAYAQQDSSTYYYNSEWRDTSAVHAAYYRKAFRTDDHWGVRDYYMNGTLQMTGAYADAAMKVRDGAFVYYDESGVRESYGSFTRGMRSGEWMDVYETGAVRSRAVYKAGNIEGWWNNWYANGKLRARGKYRHNKAVGRWKWYYENGVVASSEKYRSGKLRKATFYNEDGSKTPGKPQIEVMAEYKGGETALYRYLQNNIRYPQDAIEQDWEGTVRVRFIVDTDGSVIKPVIRRGAYPALDAEALRVVRSMPAWTPARSHNLPVRVYFLVPVTFRLQ
ncbi:MAG: TonB family protein [Chitinophagaceae bacterium]